MAKKDKLTLLTKEVFASDAGKLMLAELYLTHVDNPVPSDRSLLEVGMHLGKAELVKDLFRIVYGKAGLSKGVIDAKMIADDLDYYGE